MMKPQIDSSAKDIPITRLSEDKLDRGTFAKLIANALVSPNESGATVIGLMGPWGTGKSSAANLIIDEVGAEAIIVRFEPWMVTTRESLALEFFTTLGKHIFPGAENEESKGKRARFYRYASKALGVLTIGAGAVGGVVPGAGLVAGAGRSLGEVFEQAAAGMESIASEPTLREARDSIANDLLGLDKPVIIVIDDIDRLDRNEAKTIFQLVKACADFPNVRYLLLFDREQVIHALQDSVNNPEAFLEKVINQAFDLPEATTKQRSSLLDDALTSLGLHDGLSKTDMERLSRIFDEALLPGLPTVRHVKRYVNTVRSLVPGVIVDGFRNIDPADFLALEYLRQYVPSIYSVLRDEQSPNPGGFVARTVNYKKLIQQVEERRKAAVDALPEPLKPLAEEALKSLFDVNTTDAAAHAACRFKTNYWKPVYLGFSDARANIKESEWSALLQRLESGHDVSLWLDEWQNRDTRDRWVTAICARATEIPESRRATLLAALFKWGDKQGHEETHFMATEHYGWTSSMSFCSTALLEATRTKKARCAILEEAITNSGALVSPALVVGMEASRQEGGSWGHWSEGVDLSATLRPLADKLGEEVDSGRLWEHPDPAETLTAWHYVDKARQQVWHKEMASDQARLVKYLNLCLGCERDDKEILDWQIDPKILVALKDINVDLLTEDGAWARQHCLDSAERIRSRRRTIDDDEPSSNESDPDLQIQ